MSKEQAIERAIAAVDSAEYTATQTIGPIRPPIGARAAYIFIDVTASADTPSVTPSIVIEAADGSDVTLWSAAAAITGVSENVYLIGANVAAAAHDIDEVEDRHLPMTFKLVLTHADADSITYSVRITWA